MLQIFDAPQALTAIDKRPSTTIAPQALLMMNNKHIRSWAHSFAKQLAPDAKTPIDQAIKKGYQVALSRDPTPQELMQISGFVHKQMQSYKTNGHDMALTDFCQVLMCLNEFIYVD
jgi:hypothetical protein